MRQGRKGRVGVMAVRTLSLVPRKPVRERNADTGWKNTRVTVVRGLGASALGCSPKVSPVSPRSPSAARLVWNGLLPGTLSEDSKDDLPGGVWGLQTSGAWGEGEEAHNQPTCVGDLCTTPWRSQQ